MDAKRSRLRFPDLRRWPTDSSFGERRVAGGRTIAGGVQARGPRAGHRRTLLDAAGARQWPPLHSKREGRFSVPRLERQSPQLTVENYHPRITRNRSEAVGRARLSPGRRSRNQSGARTFLSAATSNRSRALEPSDPVEHSGVAADKNVRAPVPSQKSSRFAQTLAYSNSAGRSAGRGISRRAGDSRALPIEVLVVAGYLLSASGPAVGQAAAQPAGQS